MQIVIVRSRIRAGKTIKDADTHLVPEEPILAIITSRFDMGFIVKHPNGLVGQLRVPEMSASTAEFDRTSEKDAGIGSTVEVYIVRETAEGYVFSEFSSEERSARDQKRQDWIKAQERAFVGQTLLVRVERKLEWGCICRQEAEPYLEGVVPTLETVTENQLPMHCAIADSDWHLLTEGSSVLVVIAYKQWAHWRYVLYFSVVPSVPDEQAG